MASTHEWHPKDRITLVIAAAALVATTLSAISSCRSAQSSANSANASTAALSMQQKTILIAHCGFPRAQAADYTVPLNSKAEPKFDTFIPTYGAFSRDKFHDYQECSFENLGQYPLLDIKPALTVQFSRTDRLGNAKAADVYAPFTYEGLIDAIGAKGTSVVWIYNDDPCFKATVTLNENASLLAVPYEKPTTVPYPGWIKSYQGLRPRDAVIDVLAKHGGHLFDRECKNS